MAEVWARTGKFEASQAHTPDDEREPLFLELDYFDEMIAEQYGKRFGEEDAYRAAEAVEARDFDPARSKVARQAYCHIAGGETPWPPRPPAGRRGGAPPATDLRISEQGRDQHGDQP